MKNPKPQSLYEKGCKNVKKNPLPKNKYKNSS